MALQVPAATLFVAFSNGPLDANPVWTEIDQDLLSLDTLIGRQHQLDRIEPGTLSVTLDNRRGDYSPWDTLSPYYNLLTATDSTFTTVGTWTASSGAIATTSAQALFGTTSAQLTATAAKETVSSGHYAAATAGQQYSASAYMKAATTGEQFQVGLAFFTSGGAQIGSTTFGTATADVTTGWTQLAQVTATAPATTAFVAVVVSSVNTTSNTHYLDCVQLCYNPPNPGSGTTPTIGWTLGQTLPMVPGKPVKALAQWPNPGGTSYPVFYGFADSWTPMPVDELNQNAQLKASDVLKLLNLKYLVNNTLYPSTVLADSPLAYYRMGDTVGSVTAADSSGNAKTATLSGAVAFGVTGELLYDPTTACDLTDGSGTTGSGFFTTPALTSGAWSAECWFLGPKATTVGSILVARGSGNEVQIWLNSAGQVQVQAFTMAAFAGGPVVTDGKWHHIVVTGPGTTGTLTLYVDGQSVATGSSATGTGVGGGAFIGGTNTSVAGDMAATIEEVAFYNTQLSAARVAAHYSVGHYFQDVEYTGQRIAKALIVAGFGGFPQNLATGTVLCQAETTVTTASFCGTYCLAACDTENGLLYQDPSGTLQFKDRHYPQTNPSTTSSQGTYGDQGGSFCFDVTGLQLLQDDVDYYPDVLAQRNNGVAQEVSVAAAVAAGGERTLQRTGLLGNSDSDMLNLAQWLAYLYSNPMVRCSAMKLSAAFNGGANLPQMLGRALWDCVTVQRMASGESQLNSLMVVESVAHHFDTALPNWETTFQLSPFEVSPAANLALILNSATLGLLNTNVLGG